MRNKEKNDKVLKSITILILIFFLVSCIVAFPKKGKATFLGKATYGLDFSDGLALVTKNELTNEKIYIDENGKQAFELNFYNSSYFDGRFKNGLAVVRIKGKGDDVHINKKGKVVFVSK